MNLQQTVALASLLTSLGPVLQQVVTAVIATVRAVETAFPTSEGKTKFDAAMGILTGIFGELTTTAGPLFSALINGTVATLNAVGEFKKASTSATAPTPPTP